MTRSSRLEQNFVVAATHRLQVGVCLISAAAVGLVATTPANDVFRFPKDLWVRGEAIVLVATWLVLAIYGHVPRFSKRDWPVLILVAAAVAWTWITALLSTNFALSVNAALWVSCVAVVLVTIFMIQRERTRVSDLWWVVLPGCVNSVVATAQASQWWNPFVFEPTISLGQRITAFVGNANELGAYLTVPFLTSVAMMVGLPRKRWLFAIGAVVCLDGLIASRTRTALAAAVISLFALVWIAAKKRALAAASIAAACVAIVIVMAAAGFVTREDVARLRTIDGLNSATTYRVTPFLAAWRMFERRPLIGVGPGAFSFWYFDDKIAVERAHPALFHTGEGFSNFGEAHNDHVQLLAETGIAGYAIFLASLALIASRSFGPSQEISGAAAGIARLLAFPLATALFVLSLALFPLRVASSTMTFGFVAMTILGWSGR